MLQAKQHFPGYSQKRAISVYFTSITTAINIILERCNRGRMSPIAISQLLSMWRHSYYDVWCLQTAFSLWRHSHCDLISYWPGHAHRYGRRYVRTPYRV